jgi:uncharacterized protein with ParB-like and HNH nuclease domain
MSDDISVFRSVGSLLTESFFVPKYQRGYRWEEKQVTELLEDIRMFKPITNNNGQTEWYCLQPLVVRKHDGCYNLIDGQQRLTTIYLILHYLNTGIRKPRSLYSLKYETRDEKWTKILNNEKAANENIDFFHIFIAYKTITEWFAKLKAGEEEKFSGKLLTDCKFIWYDIDQSGQTNTAEEDVFIRLNIGKIPLTNSELIKALFLNRSNFLNNKNEDEIRLRQLGIATQWDTIEEDLANNEFWYFINGAENVMIPRIEYIFDIIADNIPKNTDDDYTTFRYFQDKFENLQEDKYNMIKNQWELVYKTFITLKGWFQDRFYYHHVGYLLSTNSDKMVRLVKDYISEDKNVFKSNVIDKIKKSINWNGDEINKGDKRIKRILLLHNVLTMQKHENDTSRFPFEKYLLEKWDIEHIHAVAEEIPEESKHRKEWKEEAMNFISYPDLQENVRGFLDYGNDDAFKLIYEEVNRYFFKNDKKEDIDSLSNLALLDARTNREYGCSYFPQKRKTILEKDKNGQFIPVCTKNVFHKYYTQELSPNMTFWGEHDRRAYLTDIINKLEDYLTKQE